MAETRRAPWTALVVALLAVAAAAAIVLTGRHVDRLDKEGEAASAAAEAVTVVAEALQARSSALAVAASDGTPADTAEEARARGVSLSALTLARDSGRPVLDDSGPGFAVAAVFDGAVVPADVRERRQQLTGYRVEPLDLSQTLESSAPEGGGLAVDGPDRRVQSVPSSGPGPALSHTASLGSGLEPGWSVTAWTASARVPGEAWLLALSVLAAGLATAGWVAARQRGSRQRQAEAREAQRSNAMVAEVATLAQHSLDLGDVLPGVATKLSAALGLRGLSLTVPAPSGERPVFMLGVPPDPQARPGERQRLDAGETMAVLLSRGGRTVATLRVTAGRDLGPEEVRGMVAAGEVLASAISNAEVFAQQSELIARMRSVDELKTVFLGTASHELRTPAVALAGYANLLHTGWDDLPPETARGLAQRVDSVAQRLTVLVEDILDFSRLQSGSGPGGEPVVLDLSEMVGRLLEEQPDLAPDHQVHHVGSPGVSVLGTQQAVERVLANLVGNAAKYSEAGGAIRVITRRVDDHAELVVEDEGPGIPAEQRGQVFSPFYRGSSDEVVRTRGAGLGLAVVTEFAASMGGTVRVGEAPGGGASFVVTYPIAGSQPAPQEGLADVQA